MTVRLPEAVTGINEGIPDESPEVRLLFVNSR